MHEVEKLEVKFTGMVDAVKELTGSVNTLVERDIRSQEKEHRQDEINNRLGGELKEAKKEIDAIKLARAEEAQGRKMLNKYYWVLGLIGLASTGIIIAAIKDLF